MLLERADGSPIAPGEAIGREEIKLPPLGKLTPWAYYQALTIEQAFALALVAKVSQSTPDAIMRTKLAKRGLTVFPKGDAPKEAEVPKGLAFPVGGVPLDPRVQFSMAAPATDAERGAEP